MDFFASFSSVEFLSAFIVLFAVIDPIGIMPIVLSIRDRGKIINPVKAVFFAFGLMFLFFFVGDWILNLFGVDINSFAVESTSQQYVPLPTSCGVPNTL